MKISQMPLSTTPSSDDVLAMLEGGTQNKKITFGAVAEWIANEEENESLNTNSKTLVGAVNELSDKNTELKNDLDEIGDEVFIREDVVYADYGDDLTSTMITSSYRWFYPIPVSANDIVDKVGLTVNGSYTSNGTPLNVDFYDLDNGTLIHKKTIATVIPTEAAGEYCEISCDGYSSNKPTYIAFRQGRSMLSYTGPAESDSVKMMYTATGTSDVALASLSKFNGRLNVDIKGIHLKSKMVYDSNVIHIGEGLQYEEIQYALDAVNDSANNPYTFIIHPKSTPYSRFSMIRRLTDAYPWTNAPVRHISLIGMDKYHCVVEDDTGNYATPPAEILTNGIVRNLTFVATKTNQSASAAQGSYAVHIDAEPVGNVGYDMQFENCVFESDQTAGVGIGLHNACHLSFENCSFRSTAEASYAPHEGYTNLTNLGAFNCHSSTHPTDTDQVLTIKCCTAIANENKSYVFATNADCNMTLKAYQNTFWCEETAQANGYKGSYCTIYGASHGNNAAALNA